MMLAVLASCGETKEAPAPVAVDHKEVLLDSIAKLEATLKSVQKIGAKQQEAFAMISCYKQFADGYPKDERAPEYLFLGGDVANGLKQYTQAVVLYKRIYERYKDYEKRPMALFLIAHTYDENLKDYDQARVYYQKCIDEFPDQRVAQDAAGALAIMGMSPEEIIQYFESKNASNS